MFVEDARVLDINKLVKRGHLRYGERSTARMNWGRFEVRLEHDGRDALRVHFPDGRTQKLMVVRVPMRLGSRWMFHLGSRRTFKLFMPKDGDVFRSRTAWGLEYRSRHLSQKNRREHRVMKMHLRYGAIFDLWRPRYMHTSTWQRRVAGS